MIKRSSPDLDYIPAEAFQGLAFNQLVTTGDLLFIGGTAPVRGSDLKIVGVGNLKTQCMYVLEVLDRSLKAGGSSKEHLLNWTVYLTDPNKSGEIGSKYLEIAPALRDWVGPHGPAATAVGVASLFLPEQMIEIEAVAAVVK
jgi:2-iminobutanoate/2-iminopropanoate deaminase